MQNRSLIILSEKIQVEGINHIKQKQFIISGLITYIEKELHIFFYCFNMAFMSPMFFI